jgi:hypothetical protein
MDRGYLFVVKLLVFVIGGATLTWLATMAVIGHTIHCSGLI